MARKSEEELILRNFYLTVSNHEKLTELAKAVGVSRAKIVNRLIDSVESMEVINTIRFQEESTKDE